MKRTLTIAGLLFAIVFLTVTAAQAGDGKSIRVNVPFAFQVGKQLFAPGQYLVEVDRAAPGTALGSRLILRSADGRTSVLLPAVPGHTPTTLRQAAGLSFHKYDATYFLAGVHTADVGCDLVQSKTEKTVSVRMRRPDQQHTVVPAE